MANVEIDETRLTNLTTVAQIADALLKNPKTRGAYLKQVKEAFPHVAIPEIDAAAPVMSEVDALKQQMADFFKEARTEREAEKIERQKRGIDRKIAEGRQKAMARGYTEDGVKALEDMMVQKGLTDFDDALKIYEHDHPLPAPARPQRGNMFDFIDETAKPESNDYIKKLFDTRGEDDNVINGKVREVLNEARGLAA